MLSIEVVFNITVSEWDNSVNTCLDVPTCFEKADQTQYDDLLKQKI